MCEEAADHPNNRPGHLPGSPHKTGQRGEGWQAQDTVGGNLSFHGEERLLAGAVPDLEETRGGGSSYGGWIIKQEHEKHGLCTGGDVIGTAEVGSPFSFFHCSAGNAVLMRQSLFT